MSSDPEYSESESESEPDLQLNSNKIKPRTKTAVKTTKIAKLESDEEDDASIAASESESDADISVDDSKNDSDEEINPEDIDEDTLFANVANPAQDNDEFQFGFDSENDDESDLEEEEDAQYLQKLDESVREQTIANHHPELIIHNYDEVEALTTVIRDERGVVIDPLHRTLPFLSKYERTRILGERAKQINDGAKPFVVLDPSVIDGYLIALKELEEKNCRSSFAALSIMVQVNIGN